MSKRKTKQGLPPVEDETNSPLPTLESREGMSFADEIALCRETQDNPLTADDLEPLSCKSRSERRKRTITSE